MKASSDTDVVTSLDFSVVIPTFERRDLVLTCVRALGSQEFEGKFEVIVVVDGSTDGSAKALRALNTPFPFAILEQSNRGAATARNQGAAVARGKILLFLDDDMEGHPRLLAEHDRSHSEGADVVYGHLPLHPNSPANFLSAGIKWWTEGRLRRLSSSGASLTLHDLMSGQMSLSKELFRRMGGFDTNFTFGGTFGNEDIDFGYRLMHAGYRLVFNPDAISWQSYVVTPRQNLRQWRQAGRADVAFARKHPEQAKTVFALNGSEKRKNRLLWCPLVALSPFSIPIMVILRWFALALVDFWPQSPSAAKFFWEIWAMEYWRGVWEAGGVPRPRPVRVLTYHAIQDLGKAPIIAPYGVPPDVFRRQLDTLLRSGFQFISGEEFLYFLRDGGGLPSRSILLTFDDGYEELLEVVLPLLKERKIPAVVFAVSDRVGGTNQWDEAIGGPRLRLLDNIGLRELVRGGVEIGAHSRTHRTLTRLPREALTEEIAGSVADLESAGFDRPRMFAYPEGEHNETTQRAVREAGILAAFTVKAGLVRPSHDAYCIPRIEVMRGDTGWKFLWKVIMGGRSMNPSGLWSLVLDYLSKCTGAVLNCNSKRGSAKDLLRKCSEDYTRQMNWWLRVGGGNLAHLEFPSNDPHVVRLAIIRVETKPEFDIQLNHSRLKARLNHHYVINFHARADRPRSIFLGFAKAHEPWDGLGLYKKIELTTEWQTFEEDFVATANDTNARIHFDVGGSDIPVELSSVSLNSIQDFASIGQHSSYPILPVKLKHRKLWSGQPPERQDRSTLVLERERERVARESAYLQGAYPHISPHR
jgi:peptidoglycan/xylan/chitin deacetylase (PgdA/CDA1 family)/GT2 family glycosyltransferase